MITGWCLQRGRPNCAACRFPDECQCRCHEGANPARNKADERDLATLSRDNKSGAESTLATSPGTSTSTRLLRGSASRG